MSVVIRLARADAATVRQFATLRWLNTGAAPLAPAVMIEVSARCGLMITTGYGLTEAAPVAHTPPERPDLVDVATVGSAVTESRGRVDKVLGADLIAVFDDQAGLDAACAHAMGAVHAIDLALERLNQKVAAEIGRLVETSIGIACGKAITV